MCSNCYSSSTLIKNPFDFVLLFSKREMHFIIFNGVFEESNEISLITNYVFTWLILKVHLCHIDQFRGMSCYHFYVYIINIESATMSYRTITTISYYQFSVYLINITLKVQLCHIEQFTAKYCRSEMNSAKSILLNF